MNSDGKKILLKSLLKGKEFLLYLTEGMDSEGNIGKPNEQRVLIALDDSLFRQLGKDGLDSIHSPERLEHEISQLGVPCSIRMRDDLFTVTPELRDELPKNSRAFLEMSSDRLISAYRRMEMKQEASSLVDFVDNAASKLNAARPYAVSAFSEYLESIGEEPAKNSEVGGHGVRQVTRDENKIGRY